MEIITGKTPPATCPASAVRTPNPTAGMQLSSQLGFRYLLHVKDMPGKPDIVLPKYKPGILFRAVSGTDTRGVSILPYL